MQYKNILSSKIKNQQGFPIFVLTFTMIMVILVLTPECQATTLTITANNGSVIVTPEKAQYDEGEIVELRPKPDTGYCFRGWAGDAQGKRLILNLTMDSDKTIIANFDTWTPPIGIPQPEFGIFETHMMYEGKTYDFGLGPEPYKDAGNGPYTHYIDNTHPAATNSGNPYGTAETPRVSFPSQSTIGPGSVIEIHGGPYSFGSYSLKNSGTQAQPIFIRGASADEMPLINSGSLKISGHYVIVENINSGPNNTNAAYIAIKVTTADEEAHHISIRNNKLGHGPYALSNVDGLIVEDVVYYNNEIRLYDMVPPDVSAEPDRGGVPTLSRTNRIWIVDNHIHHISGDGIGAGHGSNYTATNYYIGRNIIHDASENAIDLKEMENVVVSENIMYNFAGGSKYGRSGVAVVVHYGPNYSPKNVWFLYNEIYNANVAGIQVGGGQLYDVYIIGNIIHDIRDGIVAAYMFEHFDEGEFIFPRLLTKGYINTEGIVDPGFISLDAEFKSWFSPDYDQFTYIEGVLNNTLNSQERANGYVTWSSKKVYMINNVFYNNDQGIYSHVQVSGSGLILHNNIISNISDTGYHISLAGSGHMATSEISHNIFHQPGDEARIVWGGLNYNLAEFQANTGKGEGCLDADPLFVDAENNNFSLQAGSPAIDAGIEHFIYQQFQDTFGIDIRKDIEGNPRTGAWDIGAYEYGQGIVLSLSSTSGGSVTNPGEGSYPYDDGTVVSIEATADDNYYFVNWTGTAVDTGKVTNASAASTTVTVDAYYTIQANFDTDLHTLTVSSTGGGSVTNPGEGPFMYDDGTVVSIQATADDNYHFVNWSGDLSGSSNPASIIMDSDKSITANFAANTYSLAISAVNGSVTKTPNKASYSYGETVTLQAVLDTGYNFVNWSGDLSGSSNPASIIMDSDKSVTANFAANTYSLTTTAANGSVTKTPNKASYSYGETVTLQAVPDTGYNFVNWSGDLSGSSNPASIIMDSDKSVTANFTDKTAPTVTDLSPGPNDFLSDSVPLNSLILLDITDTGKGVDRNTVEIRINNALIYDGDNETSVGVYDSTGDVQTIKGICRRIGSSAAYKYIFQPDEKFDYDQQLSIAVNAADLAITPNTMSDQYSLISEQHSFGENKILYSGSSNENWGPLTTVSDSSSGHIWIAWPQGQVGSRDIYVGKLTAGTDSFVNSGIVQVTEDNYDQGNPVIAIDSFGKLYLAWQDKRRGNWDIYVSTSDDGENWSSETMVNEPDNQVDPDPNQTNPAIVIDSFDKVYIAYEDDRNGDMDIYITSSSDDFLTKITSLITSAAYDQTTPDIAVDSDDTVYVVWADARSWNGNGNPMYDFYGAASNNSWTDTLIVIEDDQQSNPKIATEVDGTILHFVWLDDRLGDDDIYYATSDGLPGSPLDGSSVIDDNTGADQISPVIITTGPTPGNDLKVFACWRDERNTDADLYAVEITACGTNIFVGDNNTSTDQSKPAIGIDQNNHPYLVWINERTDICYAGSIQCPDTLASTNVSTSSAVTVGTTWNAINSVDDVSSEMPQGAYLCDVEVAISLTRNPPKFPLDYHSSLYEFGPSGMEFIEPVTITIIYEVIGSENLSYTAYWYNPLTGTFSQQGITDVETIVISSTLHAVRFKTTHFSAFILGGGAAAALGGGGGGGCSVSAGGEGNIVEFILPYIGLFVVMAILKVRDARVRKTRNISAGKC